MWFNPTRCVFYISLPMLRDRKQIIEEKLVINSDIQLYLVNHLRSYIFFNLLILSNIVFNGYWCFSSAKAKIPDEFLVHPKDLEENHSISLMCSADVGGPRGNISIWRIPQNSDTSKLIYTSNFTNTTTENCTDIINVTTTFTVTKEDNGTLFRCSSQNNLTQGQGPNKESSRIIVICMYMHLYVFIFHHNSTSVWNRLFHWLNQTVNFSWLKKRINPHDVTLKFCTIASIVTFEDKSSSFLFFVIKR